MEALIQNVSALPRDVMFPFPMSKDSVYLALKGCNLQVFVSNGVLAFDPHTLGEQEPIWIDLKGF
jgi:hypothetical protein